MSHPDEPICGELLTRFVPMSALTGSYLKELIPHAHFFELAPGEDLAGALSSVESIVYLVEGAIRFCGAEQPDTFLRAGEPAARFAVQGGETEGRSVETIEPCRLLRVDRAKVSTLLIWAEASTTPHDRDEQRLRQDLTSLLLQSRLFQRIPPGNLERVADLIEPVKTKAGDTIVRQGEPGDFYYIIEAGRCEVLRATGDGTDPVSLAHLEPGDCFGEEALLTDGLRNATVRMETDGVVMRLTREYFVDLISTPLVTEVTHERAEDLIATGARWLDVRLREEFEHDGLDDALSLPLGELRARAVELPAGASFVTYSNSGRRAQAGAFLLSQRGLHVSFLRDGIAWKRPARRGIHAVIDSLPDLHRALLEVDAELDRALRAKAEADAARDVEQRLLPASQVEAEQRLAELTTRSEGASGALREAMERKRELEARVRDVEAAEVSRRRAAEAECDRLREDAERRLEAEKLRLSRHYQAASEKLEAIERERREAEERFAQERARMERELAQTRARMEAEAARIRETMDAERRQAESRANGIRNEFVSQEKSLRLRTEEGLREERGRLEQEFAMSVAAQEKARREMDRAEAERAAAEHETEQLRQEAQSELDRRREQDKAERDVEVERLRRASEEARRRLDNAQRLRDAALQKKNDYSRTLTEDLQPANPQREAQIREELSVHEQALARADSAVAQAEQAHASATQAQTIAEETAVAARERADELRLKLYEEMEEWISDEESRSREALEQAAHYAQRMERIQAEKEAKRQTEASATENMLSDIQQMLAGQGGDDTRVELLRARLEAEEKARLVQRARKQASEQLRRARDAAGKPDDE